MKLPKALLDKLDSRTQELIKKGSSVSEDYLSKLKSGNKDKKEKTREVLWSIYEKEGYIRFLQVVDKMRSFKDRDFNDLVVVKGEMAEVILEILIYQYIRENKLNDWYIIRSLILGNEQNKKFSTELDMLLITPMIVTVIEIKSYNGEKTITGDCSLKAVNSGQVQEKDIFRQNAVHIKAFWDNFQRYAKSNVGVVKSVLFSFSKGAIIDQRDKSKISIMPVYTEETMPSYLQALHNLDREPLWDVNKLLKAIDKARSEARSAEDHIKYVKSLHSD